MEYTLRSGDPTFEAACYRVAWTLVFAAPAIIAVALFVGARITAAALVDGAK